MALFNFDNADREMQLISLYPHVTVAEVRARVGGELRASKQVVQKRAPSEHEIRLSREELHPAWTVGDRLHL